MNKISGPLLDRIDLHVEVTPVKFEEISKDTPSEASELIRKRVIRAREIQRRRFEAHAGLYSNAQMGSKQLRAVCQMDTPSRKLLESAMTKMDLSARAYDRILKVSRTIADLENSEKVTSAHLAEAIQYRSLDRGDWGK